MANYFYADHDTEYTELIIEMNLFDYQRECDRCDNFYEAAERAIAPNLVDYVENLLDMDTISGGNHDLQYAGEGFEKMLWVDGEDYFAFSNYHGYKASLEEPITKHSEFPPEAGEKILRMIHDLDSMSLTAFKDKYKSKEDRIVQKLLSGLEGCFAVKDFKVTGVRLHGFGGTISFNEKAKHILYQFLCAYASVYGKPRYENGALYLNDILIDSIEAKLEFNLPNKSSAFEITVLDIYLYADKEKTVAFNIDLDTRQKKCLKNFNNMLNATFSGYEVQVHGVPRNKLTKEQFLAFRKEDYENGGNLRDIGVASSSETAPTASQPEASFKNFFGKLFK